MLDFPVTLSAFGAISHWEVLEEVYSGRGKEIRCQELGGIDLFQIFILCHSLLFLLLIVQPLVRDCNITRPFLTQNLIIAQIHFNGYFSHIG